MPPILTSYSIGKQKITDQIAQLKYKEPNSPRIVVLEQELVRAEAESLVAEAQLSNITREKLKAAFTYQFDALKEHSEKLAIIAGFGKHLLELVDDTPVTPGETREAYDGYEASKAYASNLCSVMRVKNVYTDFTIPASSRTVKTLSPIGSLPTQRSSHLSAPELAISPSVATSRWARALTSLAKIRVSRTARVDCGFQLGLTANIPATTRKKRRRKRKRPDTRLGDVRRRGRSKHRE